MFLNHIAAILLFSGPFFYIGLWMIIDPAGFAGLPQSLGLTFMEVVRKVAGRPAEEMVEPAAISRRQRRGLRLAGVVVLLFAIVI